MTSLNISLPEALKEYIEGQVATGDWGTPSECIRDSQKGPRERIARTDPAAMKRSRLVLSDQAVADNYRAV